MSEEPKQLTHVAPAALDRSGPVIDIQQLLSVAADPACDPAKAREVYAFAKEVMQDEAKRQWTQAFMAARGELDGLKIRKNGAITYAGKNGNPDSVVKFMRYDDIADAIKPILLRHGLAAAYTYRYETTPPKTICVMRLMHTAGHTELFESPPLPMVDSGGGKNDVQGAGSVGTYGRRYVVCPTFDIVAEGEDDDGNLGRDQPQPITEAELETITNVVQACDDKSPGFRGLFTNWLVKEMKVQQLRELHQGKQLKAVMLKLKEKQKALGLL
jgi:hypothetical protein